MKISFLIAKRSRSRSARRDLDCAVSQNHCIGISACSGQLDNELSNGIQTRLVPIADK
jgi:hypothetical protein